MSEQVKSGWFPRAVEATRSAGDFIRTRIIDRATKSVGDFIQEKIYGTERKPAESPLSKSEQLKKDEQEAVARKTPYSDTTDLRLTIFNIVNFLITPMIAGTPMAVYYGGLYLTGAIFLLVSIGVWISMNMLIRTAKRLKLTNYQEIALFIDGERGFLLMTLVELCYYEGVLTILLLYMTMNSTYVLSFISTDWGESEAIFGYVLAFVTIVIMWPSSLTLNPLRLAKLSLICLILFSISCGLLTYILATFDTSDYNYGYILPTWSWNPPNSGECVAVIISALKDNTLRRWNIAFGFSLIIYLLILIIFSYGGYTSFFEYTQGNILENLCIGDQYAVAVRVLMGIMIFLFYPVIIRFNLEVIQIYYSKELSKRTIFFIITGFTFTSALLALPTRCVAILHGFHGSLLACPMLFIIPSYFCFRTNTDEKLTLVTLSAIIVFCAGIFISLYSLSMTISNINRTLFLCSQGKEPYYCYDVKPPDHKFKK